MKGLGVEKSVHIHTNTYIHTHKYPLSRHNANHLVQLPHSPHWQPWEWFTVHMWLGLQPELEPTDSECPLDCCEFLVIPPSPDPLCSLPCLLPINLSMAVWRVSARVALFQWWAQEDHTCHAVCSSMGRHLKVVPQWGRYSSAVVKWDMGHK